MKQHTDVYNSRVTELEAAAIFVQRAAIAQAVLQSWNVIVEQVFVSSLEPVTSLFKYVTCTFLVVTHYVNYANF